MDPNDPVYFESFSPRRRQRWVNSSNFPLPEEFLQVCNFLGQPNTLTEAATMALPSFYPFPALRQANTLFHTLSQVSFNLGIRNARRAVIIILAEGCYLEQDQELSLLVPTSSDSNLHSLKVGDIIARLPHFNCQAWVLFVIKGYTSYAHEMIIDNTTKWIRSIRNSVNGVAVSICIEEQNQLLDLLSRTFCHHVRHSEQFTTDQFYEYVDNIVNFGRFVWHCPVDGGEVEADWEPSETSETDAADVETLFDKMENGI